MPDFRLWWRDLPGTTQALTDGVRNVWFDLKLQQV